MEHIRALAIKYAIILVALAIVLTLLTDLTFWSIVLISIVVTAVVYIVGDLIILPQSNNTVATISDLGLAFVTIYAFNYYYTDAQISWIDALIAAAVIAAGEWIYHKYVSSAVVEQKQS